MTASLRITQGQFSEQGRKSCNQDYCGVFVPSGSELESKGIAVALADGISSSEVSQEASKTSVSSFFEDYFSSPDSWSVEKSARCVLNAINSWLFSQTRRSENRYNMDKGYVCTFSAMIFKANQAHLFHIGDARIYQLHEQTLECLTREHRLHVSADKHYLQRALGMSQDIQYDYMTLDTKPGNVFILTTDGVYEFLEDQDIAKICHDYAHDLDLAARKVVEKAYQSGSDDNLTFQIIRVEQLAKPGINEFYEQVSALPFLPVINTHFEVDDFVIIRPLYQSARSHVYLALDKRSNEKIVLKAPSTELQNDNAHLERMLLEEWVSKRINNPHVLKPHLTDSKKTYFYITTEYIEGETLAQWMFEHPKPSLYQVRDIVEQIAKGLQAFHRLEILHQDLRPENIMIDGNDSVTIIDFGSALIAGLEDMSTTRESQQILGTAQYSAPEYFIGEYICEASDQFSLAVITYQMLCGRLPYGSKVAQTRTKAQQRRLTYRSVLNDDLEIPAWVDYVLQKALNPNPAKRYAVISEFVHDLRYPSSAFFSKNKPPIIERNPVAFWKSVSIGLVLIILYLLNKQSA